MNTLRSISFAILFCVILATAMGVSPQPGVGPNLQLPAPKSTLIPTINVAPAVGWGAGEAPKPAEGMFVTAFASDLGHPRTLFVLPNNDILVAETNAPPKPDDMKGLKGLIMKREMKKAGAAAPSANRITLLRDADGDGIAEVRTTFINKLNSPFGMALVHNTFYVADTDALLAFTYTPGATRITTKPVKIVDLPAGTINHHWTKSLVANNDGSRLYVGVGSNSNVAENGLAAEDGRACIWEVDPAAKTKRIYATGLRNAAALDWLPSTNTLWAAVNERDELGNDLVPDFLTSVRDGAFYGWPFCYFGQHIDKRVNPQNTELVARAVVPDYGLGAHVAALGLAFTTRNALTEPLQFGAFIGEHGSWNRSPHSGYKVVFVKFDRGMPVGDPIDVLTGFLSEDGKARGRPVGVAVDKAGALLVADDVGNAVWRVMADAEHRANQETD